MNSTKPTTSVDPEFLQVLRNALGIGLCAGALILAGIGFMRAQARLSVLDAAAGLEEAMATADPSQRQVLVNRSADILRTVADRQTDDPAAALALARLRLAQALGPGADSAALLEEASRYAQAAQKRGAGGAETFALRAEIAFRANASNSAEAAGYLAQSYKLRPLDRTLGRTRARLGLRIWADLDAPTRQATQAETCLVMREAPALGPELAAAALDAEDALLPSDFAVWAADPGCQAQS